MPIHEPKPHAVFKPHEIAKQFPATADTLLLDQYLTDEAAASARIFRVYRPTPPHFHAGSDEYLYVLSGRGTFWLDNAAHLREFAPGDLLFFKQGTVHAFPELIEEPVAFLALDTPRRDPGDVIFIHPEDASPETFIATRGSSREAAS